MNFSVSCAAGRGERFTAEYREGTKVIRIALEDGGVRPVILFDRRAFERWDHSAQRLTNSRSPLLAAAFGVLGALATSRLISSLLFEVSARDVTVLALVSIGLVCVSVLACVLPARRATGVDAVEVLRGD